MAAAFTGGGGPFAYAGTVLLTAAFYTLTAHIAARYVIGGTAVTRAGAVGVGLAVVSVALRPYGAVVVVPASILADAVLLRAAYREPPRTTALLVVGHLAASVVLGVALLNLIGLLAA